MPTFWPLLDLFYPCFVEKEPNQLPNIQNNLLLLVATSPNRNTVKPRFSERQNSEKPLFSERSKVDQISVLVHSNLQNSEKPLFSEQIPANQTVH